MRRRLATPPLALSRLAPGLLAAACTAGAPDGAAPDASVLLDADRDFAAAVDSGGADAWARWFTEDGAMIQAGTGEIRGREAIREAVAYLDTPGTTLHWEPTRADIATSGDLGWTTGTWTFRTDPGAPPASRGRYVSIWRKQPDGGWNVVMDLGNPVNDDG